MRPVTVFPDYLVKLVIPASRAILKPAVICRCVSLEIVPPISAEIGDHFLLDHFQKAVIESDLDGPECMHSSVGVKALREAHTHTHTREGVVALADSLVQKPRTKPGEGGTVRHGLLVREAPPHCGSSGAARPQTAAPASSGALKARSGSVKTVSSTGEKGGANNVGIQTDSPKRSLWLAGRGATYALSPVDTYRGGVTVNSRPPEGPFVHGEDIRFMGPKKRGGIGQSQGVKALTASGRLMGSEVRAWWPDEAPPDDGYIPQHGETTLWQSSPFAIGRGMDQYDRRTFGPNMSNTEWVATCKELKYASTKLSEMERSLRKGMLERTKALGREVSIASKPYWAVSKAPGSMASAALSQQSTRPSCAGTASEAGLRPADTVISTGSHIPGYVMGGTLKVNDWLSSSNPSSEASIVLDAGKSKTRVIPDYEKLERGARFGDGVLKTMRGQEVLDESLRMRDDPPRADQKNKRAERPHAIRNFRYFNKDGEFVREKRISIPDDELCALTKSGAVVSLIF